tara:strand:- start:3390 stop:5309 length:1920 start_codon:yes stop_codon:yes gene_type:complete
MADNKRNPKNNESALFRQLTRLLSGPLVNYRTQTSRKLSRVQLDKFKFQSASGLNFKKSSYNPFEQLSTAIMANQLRAERYQDFEQMEYTPEIASALDIYADEMTTSSDLQPLLTIRCHNEEIKAVLSELYHTVLNIDFNLFGWSRSMCKYGDFFLYLDIDERLGVTSAIGLPTHEIERLEGEDKSNPKYVQFQWNSGGLTFENWQMAHFRILGNDKYAPYGTSVLEPARRIFRQLILLEDAMMSYRIVRAPERRVFYIDVGNVAPNDVETYMQKVMTQMKRNQVVDSNTGRVDLRYNPMSTEEDYFIPVRGGVSSRIENLPGGTYTGDIDDVKYLRDKLFSALKVPASYLTNMEGADEDKTTLAQKDIRFARTIQRLQRSIIAELEKVGIIHLYTLGYTGSDLISFKLSLNNPSKLAELQELEHWKTKFDVAATATDGFFSRRWVADHIFNLSEEEFIRNQREMFFDRRLDAELEGVAAAVEGEAGGMGGDTEDLGDAGDIDDLLGGDEAGADTAPVADEPAAEPADDTLLAAPGKRDDQRRMGKSGPNKRRTRSKSRGVEIATPRTTYPGGKGYESLGHLGNLSGEFRKAGLYQEDEKPADNLEERRLFEVKQEMKKLITELDNSKLGDTHGKNKTQ